jgi:hypothetical protein
MSNGGVAKPSERGEKKGIKRDRRTMNRLKMYNTKAVRDRKGKVVYEQYKVRVEKFYSIDLQSLRILLIKLE